MIWAAGCLFVVLLYSISFDNPPPIISYFRECSNGGSSTRAEVHQAASITFQWFLASFASSLLDIFAIQPVFLLVFSLYQIQKERRNFLARKMLSKKRTSKLSTQQRRGKRETNTVSGMPARMESQNGDALKTV